MPFPRKPRNREPLTESALYEYAVGALARRMRTVAELRRLMRTRVEPGETGEAKMAAVIARLQSQRYLDDRAFAADYARLRQENSRFGKRRVRQDLQIKGVNSELISETLDAAYEDVEEEALARRHLERKGIRQPTNDKESARVMRMLIRAGFSTSTVYKILRQWNASDEALTALDNADNLDDSPAQ